MSMFGNAKSNSSARINEFCIESLKSVTICETSNVTDSNGNVIISASCCKTFSSQPSAEDEVTTRLLLIICAEDKIKSTSIY